MSKKIIHPRINREIVEIKSKVGKLSLTQIEIFQMKKKMYLVSVMISIENDM